MELRPVTKDDLPLLDYLTNDPVGAGEFGWSGWRSPHTYRDRWEGSGLINDDGGALVIERDGEAIGFVSWRKAVTSRSSYCWNIGIAITPDQRGKGIGTQAQRELARYLFAHTQVNRIEADTEVDNIAEQRALDKAGFTREGVLRGGAFRDGEWRDGVVYSVLRGEI